MNALKGRIDALKVQIDALKCQMNALKGVIRAFQTMGDKKHGILYRLKIILR